ncbi:helix-turn-helix domain-containing protein [Streptomyces mangrovisoli]|uniref:LacI family transcriptional regulator n=1 Tax=Streptomyces mangrovisoli TaxID=1428628 RepID=A0A1J4P2V0_9ACTN|nr:XRE family transcriptional regulator [Streptomyces mangrovisoli]OIJ68076.1 LacI family transcriptional regulator [Streptomyces mangrovisoli]
MSNIVDPLVRQIAGRVRTERERRRWTLAQLADASGVSQAMISRIERGESSPTAVVLGKLSAAFQLSVASLLALAEGTGADGTGTEPSYGHPVHAGDEGAGGPAGNGAAREDSGPRTTTVRRAADAPEWRDPGTGYRRRQISGPRHPAEVAEIRLPPGARVPYPAAAFAFVRQLVWVLDGTLTFHDGDTVHELTAGDTIELGAPAARVFANTSGAECRYAVVLTRGTQP